MKKAWFVETVTIYNKRKDPDTKKDIWQRSVIGGCLWLKTATKSVSGQNEVVAGSSVDLMIRESSDYSAPEAWQSTPVGFTLQEGDLIVYGECNDEVGEVLPLSTIRKNNQSLDIRAVEILDKPFMKNRHYEIVGGVAVSKYAKITWEGTPKAVLSRNGLNDKTLLFAATTLKRLYSPYVPFLTGMLDKNVGIYTEGSKGVVHYRSPYAHYLYEGELMVSPTTGSAWAEKGEIKEYAGVALNYNTAMHPLATSHLDRVANKKIRSQYTREVQAFIGRG